jgi:DNA-binding SARP family transcriptional activator/tetratricopeptide (TPR) repeat protein
MSVLPVPASRQFSCHQSVPLPGGPAVAEGGRGFPPVAGIKVRLLGRFAVLRGPEEIPLRAFGGRRAQQLLRLLALRRGTLVPKDVIAEALWPKRRPADAAGNTEVLVSRIRRALGDRTLIQTGPGGYSLTPDSRCWVDAEAFAAAVSDGRALLAARPAEALVSFRSALEIWQGEPLAEDTYEDWAAADRRRLTLALLEALDGAAAAALACGYPGEALTWAERALASEPLREASAMLAVRALTASGDQAGALTAFDLFRRRLARETGLDPSPDAQELRQRLLRGELLPPGPGKVPAGRGTRPLSAEPFAGRNEECAAILAAAAGRGPRLILITGPRGVGKSRLLAEAARRVRVPVLDCQAFEPDRDEAWSVAGRLLRQARRAAGADVMLPDWEARALAIRLPGLAALARPGPDADDEQNQAFALQGAMRLVEAATRPRCLITVDDLQWADPASVELLRMVLRRTDQVSVVAALQQEPAPAVALERFGLPAEQVSHLPLGPLPAEAIRGLFSDTVLAEVILAQGDRTPLTVTEVVAALAREGVIVRDQQGRWRLRTPGNAVHARSAVAAGQRQAAQDRVDRLPGRWRELLALLALLGRPAPPGLLAEACGWVPREVLDCLDGLARVGLAQPGWRGWKLRHQLFGEAQVGSLVPAERARAHALLAQALEQSGADAAEVAAHRAASGDRDRASAAYATAAAHRLERLADAEAIGLAEAGLSLEPAAPARALLLDSRAEVYRRRGLLDEARADLTAALESCDDAAGRSRVLAELALLEARSVSVARGEGLVELAIAEAQGRPGPLGQALAAGAIIDLPAGNLVRAGRRIKRARQLLEEAGETRGSARVLYWQAMASYMAGRLQEAATRLADLAYLPALPAEVLRLCSPRATRGHILALLGDPVAGLAEIEEALAWAEAAHYPAMQSECLWRRSEALAFAGRAGEAVESAERALAIATGLRHAACTAGALRGLGIAWEVTGKLDQAEEAFRRSLRAAEGNPFFAAWESARLGACLAREGRSQDAAAYVRAALSSGTPLTQYEARWARAELLAARGEDEASRAAAGEALQSAQAGGYLILVPRLQELAGS